MSYITKSVTIIITLCAISTNANPYAKYDYYSQNLGRKNVTLRQGTLQGVILGPSLGHGVPFVEVFRGVPYAAPPVGELRFMPTGGAPSWFGVRYADSFGRVCPQQFPDERTMEHYRKQYFLRLKEYLQDQSEDCLYLNIYTPHQDREKRSRKYPVMVYIHGESFEWNSGNPYDGSVLSAYGKVVVVTLNFRLGILGFLKASTEELSTSNFGLVDQLAALVWVKDNIAFFGGDPNSITLFGHGTGAACISLLTISPMAIQQKNGAERLFHRAILMGGTALADWALAKNPNVVTYQVSQHLNCQVQHDFAGCLRRKRLSEIMTAGVSTGPYQTRFGPIVDSLVVPNDPKKLMTQYKDIFQGFELMYGVTELESIHLLGPVALRYGMLEKERDEELRKYVRSRCEMKPELCLVQTLQEYAGNDREYTGQEPSKALLARDALLDILSDARSVAPIVQMAKYHAALNLQSYFYVFTHKTHSRDYIRKKSFNGEELPYVFGVPLGGPKFHFVDSYTEHERLFSEVVMTYFCNFAYTGNPNVPRRTEFINSNMAYWAQFDVEWPEFDLQEQRYLQLDIPPQPSAMYRDSKMIYWNDIFPHLPKNHSMVVPRTSTTKKPIFKQSNIRRNGNPPPWVYLQGTSVDKHDYPDSANDHPDPPFMFKKPDNIIHSDPTIVLESSQKEKQGTSVNVIITVGALFLVINLIILLILYFKCLRNKKRNESVKKEEEVSNDKMKDEEDEVFFVNGCNIVRMMSKSSKSDDCDVIKVNSSNMSNYNITRQMSNSTIDAHTKVRDWITQEIVNKYSPRFLRKPRHNPTKTKIPIPGDISTPCEVENNSTLGRSPTRPVSPVEGHVFQQPVMKTSTVTRPKIGKPSKVSVAIDATPSGRGDSVLMQQPIELTKSLDYPHLLPETEVPLRRSITLEDFSPRIIDKHKDVRNSVTNINLKSSDTEPTFIKIEHNHTRSEPVEDLNYTHIRKLKTFDPNGDVNVTSRDDNEHFTIPLTPEESLMTIKRRNFPKVLPDHPGRDALMQKRRSMPAHSLFLPIPESISFSQPNSPTNKSFTKLPPTPPPRTTTLSKQSSAPIAICASEPMLAEQSSSPESEVVCNNLYVGPLIPKSKSDSKGENLSQPIYDSLRSLTKSDNEIQTTKPKTIVTANPNMPIKREKFVVRPTAAKRSVDNKHNKHIPRVVVPDNQPLIYQNLKSEVNKFSEEAEYKNGDTSFDTETNDGSDTSSQKKLNKKSHIPTPVKPGTTKESSSSESTTPSEGSDTGTVVKKV